MFIDSNAYFLSIMRRLATVPPRSPPIDAQIRSNG